MPAKKTKTKKADTKPTKAEKTSSKPFVQTLRENKIKVGILLVLIILALIAYYFRGLFVAATVNGAPIWRYKVVTDADKIYGTEVLEPLISQQIVEQEAKEQGISVTQEELEAEFEKVREQFEATGQNLDEALEQSGLTREEAIESLRPRVYEQKLIEKQNIQVTDEEVDEDIERLYENSPDLERPTTEEEIEEQREQVRESIRSRKIQDYFQKLHNDADVEYFVDYYRRP